MSVNIRYELDDSIIKCVKTNLLVDKYTEMKGGLCSGGCSR